MILLSSILRLFESAFLTPYHKSLLPSHRKALAALKDCRTSASPMMLAQCADGNHQIRAVTAAARIVSTMRANNGSSASAGGGYPGPPISS